MIPIIISITELLLLLMVMKKGWWRKRRRSPRRNNCLDEPLDKPLLAKYPRRYFPEKRLAAAQRSSAGGLSRAGIQGA